MNYSLLQEKTDDLIKLFKATAEEFVGLDKKLQIIEERERDNRRYDKELKDKEDNLYSQEERIKKEKDFIEKQTKNLLAKELSITEDKELLKRIEESKNQWEDRKREVQKSEKALNEKMVMLADLEKRKKEMDDREMMIERSNAIDVERKRLLDIREERIKNRERQLQMEVEE